MPDGTVPAEAYIDDQPLYETPKKVYPAAVHGPFRRFKWFVMAVTLGIYYFLPFVRWDRGPNAPDQAVLVDFEGRRFYFFAIELWPQEIYYITGLLVLASVVLFLANALAGRVWCGYTCPQTVWTDLFLSVERLIEGDRRERIKLDNGPWTPKKVAQKATKHFAWLMIAWWTGGAWVLYFADAPTLVRDLALFEAPWTAYMWIGILTGTTYLLAGFAREQVCIYMCPWPRIQAALTDEHALNVTYRVDRGEPRGSMKKSAGQAANGLKTGDCIDCYQCVHVCPTGVDIREGSQLGCIQCGLCIDACNTIMDKIGKPHGLIAYDTDVNVGRRAEGKPEVFNFIRPRTLIYTGVLALVGSIMLYVLVTRDFVDVTAQHDRNPLYVELANGDVRNGYRIHLMNKRAVPRRFLLTMEGIEGAELEVVGNDLEVFGNPVIEVGPDSTRDVRLLVFAPRDQIPSKSTPIRFRITEAETGESATTRDFFKAP